MEKIDRLTLAYVGVDVHKDQHSAVVLDCFGDPLGAAEVVNRPHAFPVWLQRIRELAPGRHLLFGLENTSTWGRSLAGYLLEQGETVRDVAPIRTARKRKRHPHPDKSDVRDARAIARTLLQDLGELPATAHDDRLWTLQLLVTQREGWVRERNRMKNRLHELLQHPYPGYRGYFTESFGKAALAFWERYPSPERLSGVTVAELGAFLHAETHNFYGREKAAAILAETQGHTRRPCQAERDELLRQGIRQLRYQEAGIQQTEEQMAGLLAQMKSPLQTIPGVSVVLAAEMHAGIGDVQRFATPDKLCRYAGIAPKEWSTGGEGTRTRSEHGRRSLHATLFHLAVLHVAKKRNGDPTCPKCRAYYEKKLGEGKTKKTALVCLMRNLVRMIWRLLREQARERPGEPAEVA